MPDRTYTEEEVAALFQRAAELQVERGRRPAGAGTGLSFDDLLGIAADSGLDPQLLRRAAAVVRHAVPLPRLAIVTVLELGDDVLDGQVIQSSRERVFGVGFGTGFPLPQRPRSALRVLSGMADHPRARPLATACLKHSAGGICFVSRPWGSCWERH